MSVTGLNLYSYAAGVSVSAVANKTTAVKGDTVSVSVKVNSNPGISGIDYLLKYKTSQLKYVSCSFGTEGQSFEMQGCNNTSSGVKGACLNSRGTVNKKIGVIVTVKFKVVSEKTENASVTLSAHATNSKGGNVSVSVKNATVKLNPVTETKKESGFIFQKLVDFFVKIIVWLSKYEKLLK